MKAQIVHLHMRVDSLMLLTQRLAPQQASDVKRTKTARLDQIIGGS